MPIDRRHFRWWWQRRTRGFDDRELWSLDHTILEFTLPRLRVFAKEAGWSYPGSILYGKGKPRENYDHFHQLPKEERSRWEKAASEEWRAILNKMVRAIELAVRDEGAKIFNPAETAEFEEGMALFHEYFFSLWD